MSTALALHLKQHAHSLPKLEPLVQCSACGKEPRDVVESPCCGDVWCWQCAVERPSTDAQCARCGGELTLESFRPAKAIQALLKRNQGAIGRPREYYELTTDHQLPCPEHCGAVLTAGQLEEHIKTCGEVVEPCPNDCGERDLKRKDMEAHLRNDCPLASIPCKFGCDETILRREMDDHAKENVIVHLEQLHATVEAQRARIGELESEKQANKRCSSLAFFGRCRKLVGLVIWLVALAFMMAGVRLMGKLILACGILVGLRWAYKRVVGKQRLENHIFFLMGAVFLLSVWLWLLMSIF